MDQLLCFSSALLAVDDFWSYTFGLLVLLSDFSALPQSALFYTFQTWRKDSHELYAVLPHVFMWWHIPVPLF